MNPTNTPTSKCCELISKGQNLHDISCPEFGHTPTTDSKNSSEECECPLCKFDHNPRNVEVGKPANHGTPNHTTDTGWGKRLRIEWPILMLEIELAKKPEDLEEVRARAFKLIQHIAKEEYERGFAEAQKQYEPK